MDPRRTPHTTAIARPRIVLASRELFPFGGGGIGAYVAETARVLTPVARLMVLTSSAHRQKFHELRGLGDPRVDYGGAEVEFVHAPGLDLGGFATHMQCYSHRLLRRLEELFPDDPPDLVEFPDYLGEGFVATQARRGGLPFLARTVLAVRLHTSLEMVEVLNGRLAAAFEDRVVRDLERRTLEDADVLLDAGGDVRATYERFYDRALAPRRRVRHAFAVPDRPDAAPPADGPLRLLYAGRLERRKGVASLIDAVTTATADWRLTLVGGDTPTAPLGASMRRTLELQAAGDPRISFLPGVARSRLPELMAAHDAVVLPSHWECWPYVALEAMAVGVPVVAPAVGGFTELVGDGAGGRLAAGPGAEALRDVLGPLMADPGGLRAGRDPTAARDHVARLTDEDEIRASYLDLAAGTGPHRRWVPPAGADPAPLVSVVIPYRGMAAYLERAVASVAAQTYRRIEVLVVNDGSFETEDVVLAEVAARYPVQVLSQPNRGLAGARNFGIGQSRGRYVLPLDADNVLHPTFVARCVAVLEADESLGYVTAWSRYVDEAGAPVDAADGGYRPFGNWSSLVHERNVAGDGTALVRRRIFDRYRYAEHLTSYEDWALYRMLALDGVHGLVLPEVLWDYRQRERSMLRTVGEVHHERLLEELDAAMREDGVAWAPRNA